jgi:phosphoribosyl 1,2-cyclic phosphate phosphodiesterase
VKLTLLGSAAAEAWPALFCVCDACAEARRRGGRNLRRRTCYLVDDDTLVDFGPDIHWQSHEFGIDLGRIARILFTHSHDDHWDTVELAWRRKGFSAVGGLLDVFANQNVFDRLQHERGLSPEQAFVTAHRVAPGDRFQAGELSVLAIEADHAGDAETALNYVLRDERGGLLIANDTGWWSEASWNLAAGLQLDAAIIECTYGLGTPQARRHHLGAEASVAFRDKLVEIGALRPEAQVVVNHFTHNCGTLHEELCAWFEPRGITVGYDGLVVQVPGVG